MKTKQPELIRGILVGALAFCCAGTADAGQLNDLSRMGHTDNARRGGQNYLRAHAQVRTVHWPRQIDPTGWGLRKSIDEIDVSRAPVVADLAELQKMFERVRDARDWAWASKPGFARRIPWLYHFDGCYLRAELVADKFRDWGYTVPKQIMAFGNLSGVTAYGTATWWYHVAPVVRFGAQLYVIDVSLDATHPLTLEAWILKMVPTRVDAKVSICNTEITDPESLCDDIETEWTPEYKSAQVELYLGREWQLVMNVVGHEPLDVLGETPPWTSAVAAAPTVPTNRTPAPVVPTP